MNVRTMEGLMGASANLNLMATPMRVYEEAKAKGEEDKMERAMGYVGDFTNKAQEYNETANAGMAEEAEEAREAQKAELEKNAELNRTENSEKPQLADNNIKTNADGDMAEISEEAKAYSEEKTKTAESYDSSANLKNNAEQTVKISKAAKSAANAVKKSASV